MLPAAVGSAARGRKAQSPLKAPGRPARGLLALLAALPLLCTLLTSCYVPLQPQPLMGEGPAPGMIVGPLPQQFQNKRNPFTTADAQAVAAGRALYHAYEPSCADCHGPDGRGLGPLAFYLEPKPADFAAPLMVTALKDHQDYVFWWVSEGVSKTVMPAWQVRLSENERWQVITYVESLVEQADARPTATPVASRAFAQPRPPRAGGR